ncbi:cyanate lyase [Monoraphidium neglectum]|uniref:Cyanate lyase n=1 Tax=Monoraphidium neglectum TaxID=145388 RepID=A0A0D2LIY8_9CHLO|nr:cyanate lyase [Monoraphidium neglectum]KIZ06424.1 cyanate lyase [Monoraphidium neglectum]|eukprot:XP_013905443.1 cyanate lyase [Monoraphidium neglectum]
MAATGSQAPLGGTRVSASPAAAAGRPALPPLFDDKQAKVQRLITAKEKSGKTFSQIADEVGLTNVYTAQLFFNQQQLQPNTVAALRKAVPALTDDDVDDMQRVPHRSFNPEILQEPSLYRVHEAICHAGDSIKALINEHWGDGIMSGIGFFGTVDKAVGLDGEPRIIITLNGKFLAYTEQKVEGNIAQRKD